METWSGCIPLWWRPSRLWRAMPDALIPNEIDRRDARSWVSNPALKMMTQSSLRRPLKYLPMKLTETREATIAHEFLINYNGILISDFYPGYDSVRCRQQKCWVHLIRDL